MLYSSFDLEDTEQEENQWSDVSLERKDPD